MIAYLKGKIIMIAAQYAIVETNGVGFKVNVNQRWLTKHAEGQDVSIFTHHYIREDRQDLYGFETNVELEFFERLVGISGIGPKTALGIMEVASLDSLKSAIAKGDSSVLMKVSGVGRKTAERVVIELRGKVAPDDTSNVSVSDDADVIEALEQLGYSSQMAREALSRLDPAITGANNRVRAALNLLGKK
jgi:Holliday junction DNA helicase RuvA